MIGIVESNNKVLEETLKYIEGKKIKLALASFSDLNGSLRAKLIPSSRLQSVCQSGAGFAGFAVGDLGHGPHDPDILCIPDLRSMTILPWNKEIAWFAGTLTEDGTPWPFCTRTILLNVLTQAKSMGYTMKTGVEPEFFLVKQGEDGKIAPFDEQDKELKPCYQQQALMRNIEFLGTLIEYMNELKWNVTQADHEDANGQFEINFDFSDAVTSADRHTFFKYMIRTMAEERGLIATFMPKPFSNLTGNGCHMHLSLWDEREERNVFEDVRDQKGFGLSAVAYHFIAGILNHAKALTAIVCPTVNSYKRLGALNSSSGSTWAPNFISYGGNNRTQLIRIPDAGRIEFRAMDGSCNPYLATAAILAAGLDGIEKRMDPGDPFNGNLYMFHSIENEFDKLPSTLNEAIEALESDEVLVKALGETFMETFMKRKKAEWKEYHDYVSEWEVEKYLKGY
ncbi:type III glutamate--ammonia ligase [Aeribacillus sp. FSL K6-8394]|uniref:type III glutamate--ammonia ligase n=1 Tax=Aeribacillus sp. FSL K6-8394 TaxID=2954570 RepID=UPI0030F96117